MDCSQEKIITDNINLVYFCINKKFKNAPPFLKEELISEGKLALAKCGIAYNETMKCKFSTYAVKGIINQLNTFLKKNQNCLLDVSFEELNDKILLNDTCLKEKIFSQDNSVIDKVSYNLLLEDFLEIYESIIPNDKINDYKKAFEVWLNGGAFTSYCKELNLNYNLVRYYINKAARKLRLKYKNFKWHSHESK